MALSLSQIMQEELSKRTIEKEMWADMMEEFDVAEDEVNSVGSKKRVRRNRRRRTRKAKTEEAGKPQDQEDWMKLGLELPVSESRRVTGNVVTWNDLLDLSDGSPSQSQASTSAPTPTPTPPISARPELTPKFYAQPVPMVMMPVAFASYNQTPVPAEAQPWTDDRNALRSWQVLCQGLGDKAVELERSPKRLQGLLQSASQVPYED